MSSPASTVQYLATLAFCLIEEKLDPGINGSNEKNDTSDL